MQGYWHAPEATADAIRDGWLHTGDIDYLDPDGYLYITDRKKDMIISGGSNIYRREIEEVICQHPAVFEVTVIGIPDEKWGRRSRRSWSCASACTLPRARSSSTASATWPPTRNRSRLRSSRRCPRTPTARS